MKKKSKILAIVILLLWALLLHIFLNYVGVSTFSYQVGVIPYFKETREFVDGKLTIQRSELHTDIVYTVCLISMIMGGIIVVLWKKSPCVKSQQDYNSPSNSAPGKSPNSEVKPPEDDVGK